MANAAGRPITPLILSPDERAYLERQVRRHRVARSLSERCRVILRCADGVPSNSVASEIGVHEHTVGKWRRRFLRDRIEGLLDEARPGRPRTIDDDQVAAVIERTLRSTPKDATHWSIHPSRGTPLFAHNDPKDLERFRLAAPSHGDFQAFQRPAVCRQGPRHRRSLSVAAKRALVLSVDEKSQIQALDREQPILPMMPGVPEQRITFLCPPRHDVAVCSPRHRFRLCDR